jgi:AcrR family transcriptional regulator
MTVAPVDFAEGVRAQPDAGDGCGAECDVRHRRRGVALERAIHDAVLEELVEVGYLSFTIESVASRARTGKASIYRRWSTKQQLVVDAICGKFGETFDLLEPPLNATVGTRDALLQVARRMVEVVSDAGEAFRAAACEISRDPELATALEERVACPKREAMVKLLQRGVARGEVRADAATELHAEVLPAMITSRLIVQNRGVPDDYLERLVDEILMPLLRPA